MLDLRQETTLLRAATAHKSLPFCGGFPQSIKSSAERIEATSERIETISERIESISLS